jgi:Rrf2 family protein
MLITREVDYCIRIARALANMQKMTVSEISQEEQIPLPFAYKILKKMDYKGLVEVIRGAGGGYRLAKNPSQITLLDLFLVIDGELVLNKCQEPDYHCEYVECVGAECKISKELCRIQSVLEQELSRKSLKEILEGK